MLLVGAIAFIKIDNESIVQIVLHALGFTISNKNYFWDKKELGYSSKGEGKMLEMKKKIETKK